MFQNPIDICNRGLQHCGVTRISGDLGENLEDSKQASEVAFVYDKLRRAELRRNIWQFAIRNAALRPITTGTMLVQPVLWQDTVTYDFGAIVADVNGIMWQSRAQQNLNNPPGAAPQWEVYCGPLTAMPYDTTGTTGYYAGEIVYETPGDGTFVAYLSLQGNNAQDPRAPSLWQPLAQYSLDQVVQSYAAWAIGTTYAAGAVASFTPSVSLVRTYYVSLAGSNTGHEPDTSSTWWTPLFTSSAPAYWSSIQTYSIGNFATYGGVNYVSLTNSNTGNKPTGLAPNWAVVTAGTIYASSIDFNTNNDPSSAPAAYVATTTYASGAKVTGSDGAIYTSTGNGNVGHNPVQDAGVHWTNTGVLSPWNSSNPYGQAAQPWLTLNCALVDLQLVYPIGSGPSYQTFSKNVFRLPANFMRRAPQDPKAGSVSFLGAPTGLMYDDWELQGEYLVSRCPYPIPLRFVADIQDVTRMDDMFCEMLAARIAFEVVEPLTQSTAKRAAIMTAYRDAKTQAITVNGIETGAVEPPEDDFITCRL